MFNSFLARHQLLSSVDNPAYSLDPDQDRHIVSPDLGPNCLQNKLNQKFQSVWHSGSVPERSLKFKQLMIF